MCIKSLLASGVTFSGRCCQRRTEHNLGRAACLLSALLCKYANVKQCSCRAPRGNTCLLMCLSSTLVISLHCHCCLVHICQFASTATPSGGLHPLLLVRCICLTLLLQSFTARHFWTFLFHATTGFILVCSLCQLCASKPSQPASSIHPSSVLH